MRALIANGYCTAIILIFVLFKAADKLLFYLFHLLFSQRVIPYDKAKEEADQMGVTLFETSALNGTNIEDIFKTLVIQIKREQIDLMSLSPSGNG